MDYLKQHRRFTYANLLTHGKLNYYLTDINKQAEEMFSRLVKQCTKAEGVTEMLKVEDPMEWVGRMNNIRSRVTEVINAGIIINA